MFGSSTSDLHPEQRRSPRLTPEELVAMQIPLPSTKPMNVRAAVRYCNQARCGFQFVDLRNQQRDEIEAACEKLSKASGHP